MQDPGLFIKTEDGKFKTPSQIILNLANAKLTKFEYK